MRIPLVNRIYLILSLLLILAGCSKSTPLEIGFIGGLSGRVADLGIAGRNGAQYAVEQWNRRGGIDGRPVRLLVRDDGHDIEQARAAVVDLMEHGVAGIIGPMTSNIGVVLAEQVTEAGVVLISPTVTSDALTGRDDLFFRVIGDTRGYAAKNADYQYRVLGHRRMAVIYDANNLAYAGSWGGNFRKAFEGAGGEVVDFRPFFSGEAIHFGRQAELLLESNPDAIQIVSNALDASLLIQQLRKLKPGIPIATAEWAATERLIELGGEAVEGVVIAQFFNRASKAPRYVEFHQGFRKRFGRDPGFAAVASYDATATLLTALSREQGGLKSTLIESGPYQGVQGPILFDRFGDAERDTYITTIRNGRFEVVDSR